MLNLSYSVIGTIALIWISAVSYYLYTTGDLFIVSIIVAVIVLVFQIVTKIKIVNSLKQKTGASSKISLESQDHWPYTMTQNPQNKESVVVIL